MNKIRVLIVDDSAIVRDILTGELSKKDNIEIIGTAPDPFIARNKILSLKPDVITLDIEMPRMDGLTFLKKLMSYYPIPVIIVSSVTTQDPHASIKALEIGAIDVVNKPGGSISIKEVIEDVYQKIQIAFQLKDTYLTRRNLVENKLGNIKQKNSYIDDKNILSKLNISDKLICIGASTGGTLALEYIFKNLPPNLPPILVVQHMPQDYTSQFADRLNAFSRLNIKESEDNEIITNGNVYIGKGGYHLKIIRKGSSVYIKNEISEKVQYQRPSVDVLFESAASIMGQNTLGILLTGMGKDGANGLLSLKRSVAITIPQNEESSIVSGMPKAAIDINAHTKIMALEEIPNAIIKFLS